MPEQFDILVYCAEAKHPDRRVFVGGFRYVPENDTAALAVHGVRWAMSMGRTESAAKDKFHVRRDGNMRLSLTCRKCRRPNIAIRLNHLAPTLDLLKRRGFTEIPLVHLAAMLDGSRRIDLFDPEPEQG